MSEPGATAPRHGDDASIPRARVVRFLVVHTIAYGVAFPWAVAALPVVFAWKERELLALGDERDAVALVLRWSLAPAVAVFVLPHLLGIPWVRAARDGSRRGLPLFAAGSAALTVAGLVAGIASWVVLLGR